VLVVAACAWLYAQVTAGPPASWPERPNVILVSLDTLRADHLGCYGYERDTSPSLDAFAERALRFDNAFASSSWTLTSHMTLLTSLSPIVHAVDEDRALSTGVTTLATALLREGYFTAAVMDSGPWLGRDYGFDRGFLHVRRTLRGAPAKIARALDCLDGTDDRPFFLFLHLYDAHSDSTRLPYDAAAEDQELFRGDYAGDFTGCGSDGTCASAWMRKLNRRGEVLDEEDRRYVEALYDAGIRTLDRELGRLFRELERRDLFDDSVVVVVADHGEEFQEHGKLLHSQLYRECLRVPLLVRAPETRGGATSQLTGLIDVMPTLLELCGAETRGLQGRSFARLLADRDSPSPRDFLTAEVDGELRVLRTPEWILHRAGDAWRLFDARADPGEQRDLLGDPAFAGRLMGLRAQLDGYERTGPALPSRYDMTLSVDTLRRLGALGYFESGR
jgi:arylsulfatase A-like enzyme